MTTPTNRLFELDWLRVLLIFAVFMHHALMPFNGDDWYVMNQQSSKLLDNIMVYFEQIRLPILFFIAGAGSVILLNKIDGKQFLKDKFRRLFIPLIVGIVFIVPPQGYIENIDSYESYFAAYSSLLAKFESGHLWFIEYLIVFFVVAIVAKKMFASKPISSLLGKLKTLSKKKNGLFYLVIILLAIRSVLKVYFPGDSHGIENLSSSMFYLFFFVMGMAFIQSEQVWFSLTANRRRSLYWLIASSLVFYGYYFSPDLSDYLSLGARWQIWFAVCSVVSWAALLAIVGYAQAYLTTTPAWLKKANELIYPFYIFHQTVIVLLAYVIVSLSLPLPVKALALTASALLITSAICLLLVSPFKFSRLLFGLKQK